MKSLFAAMGYDDIHVVATYGRLFDIKTNIAAESVTEMLDLGPELWAPLKNSVLENIQTCAASVSEIWIFTDDDVEGEVIAAQISSICSAVPAACKRFRLHSLTIDAMFNALKSPGEIDMKVVEAGVARRICDRAIGYFSIGTPMGQSHRGETVGRVVSPLLQLAENGDFAGSTVIRRCGARPNDWFAIVRMPGGSDQSHRAVASYMDSLPEPDIEFDCAAELENVIGPMSGAGITVEIADRTGLTVGEVADSLQRLYENGLVSYPRSDSALLDDRDIARLELFAEDANRPFDSAYVRHTSLTTDAKISLKQGAHGALVPLSMPSQYGVDKDFLSIEQRVFAELVDFWLDCSNPRLSILREYGMLSASKTNSSWRKLKSDAKIGALEFQRRSLRLNQNSVARRINELKPFGTSFAAEKIGGNTFLLPRNLSTIVMRALVFNSIGRPSTQPRHAERFVSRFLDAAGNLRPTARQLGLSAARINAPQLLKADASRRAEMAILDSATTGVELKLSRALNSLGLEHIFGNIQGKRRYSTPYSFNRK